MFKHITAQSIKFILLYCLSNTLSLALATYYDRDFSRTRYRVSSLSQSITTATIASDTKLRDCLTTCPHKLFSNQCAKDVGNLDASMMQRITRLGHDFTEAISSENNTWTFPLCILAEHNLHQALRTLLGDHPEVDIEASCSKGTALVHAYAYNFNVETIAILLEYKANPLVKAPNGKGLLSYFLKYLTSLDKQGKFHDIARKRSEFLSIQAIEDTLEQLIEQCRNDGEEIQPQLNHFIESLIIFDEV